MIKLENIVRPNILELQPYSSARDEFMGKEGVFLDANENPFGELNRYPDPYQKALKGKLAQLKRVNTDNIFVGNGSDEIIDLAYRIFCSPGVDKVLSFSPTYGMYDVSAGINNIELLKIPLNTDFQIDRTKLEPYLTDPSLKLIFICSPNNPTGNLMKQDDIQYILESFKGIVIIDEAYIDFAGDASLVKWIDNYNNLIVSQTFSKAWGLAAARVGIAYANAAIIDYYNKVKPPYNVSRLNQEAALKVLNNVMSYQEEVDQILAEKERLIDAFQTINCIKTIYPSDANFLLIEVNDANKLYTTLVNQNIITRNRSKLVANSLRITVGTLTENNELINALNNYA